MLRRKRFTVVSLAVLLVLGSACSSGSSKSSPPTTIRGVTKASYVIQANALCTTMNRRVAALGKPGRDPVRVAALIDQVSAIVRPTLAKLRALPVPAGAGPKLAAVYATVDKLLTDSAAYSAAIRGSNQQVAIAAGRNLDAAQARADAASIKYGLTVCGS